MPARLDAAQLPDGPAKYPCPHCQMEVIVDKRKLGESQPEPEVVSAVSAPADTPTDTPPAERRCIPPLPDDASFPTGIIVGEDAAEVGEVQEKLSAVGCQLTVVDSTDVARQIILDEEPALCVFVGGRVEGQPYEPLGSLTALPPATRRKLYLALIADGVQTLDGAAAFIHQVNMVCDKSDSDQLGQALHRGIEYHDRLYQPYFTALDRKD